MTDNTPAVPGAEALTTWFGYWPSFHDGEIHELHLTRSGASWLSVETWHGSSHIDNTGHYVLEKNVLVIFRIEQVTSIELQGFNHQNVVSEITLELIDEGFCLTLGDCFGLAGTIEGRVLAVEFAPIDPPGRIKV